MNDTSPEPLFTLNFLAACASNLFLFTAMYIILPILPLYLSDELHVGSFQTGIILAAFTTAALVIRPFSGFIVEHFPGKKLFLLLYASFAICFFAYPFLSSILLVGFVRFAHGLCFGVATTASTTLAISIIPRPRLGSGIGFYGMTAALSMAIGPMLNMYTLQEYGFQTVFILAAVIIVVGLAVGSTIKPSAEPVEASKEPFSWHGLILPSGLYAFVSVPLCVFLYGLFLNYIALYAREKGFTTSIGFIFMLVSTGLIISRFFAGRLIDKGSLKAVIIYGKLLLLIAYIAIAVTYHEYIFFVASFFVGLGYGLVTPAYQTLFNNLALPSKRATANSMFFTAFDVGIASSAVITGIVGQFSTLNTVLFIGIGFMAISLLFFLKCTAPHYDADRVS